MKLVNIKMPLSEEAMNDLAQTLQNRYALADTIEEKGLGEIVNEGTGEGFMDVSFTTDNVEALTQELNILLSSLNFTGDNKIEIQDSELFED